MIWFIIAVLICLYGIKKQFSLTFILAKSGSNYTSKVFYLTAPSTGTKNLVVTFSGSQNFSLSWINLYGVDQTSPIPTTYSTVNQLSAPGTTISPVINVANSTSRVLELIMGGEVVDLVLAYDSSQTSLVSSWGNIAYKDPGATGNLNMDWRNRRSSYDMVSILLEVKEASNATGNFLQLF